MVFSLFVQKGFESSQSGEVFWTTLVKRMAFIGFTRDASWSCWWRWWFFSCGHSSLGYTLYTKLLFYFQLILLINPSEIPQDLGMEIPAKMCPNRSLYPTELIQKNPSHEWDKNPTHPIKRVSQRRSGHGDIGPQWKGSFCVSSQLKGIMKWDPFWGQSKDANV